MGASTTGKTSSVSSSRHAALAASTRHSCQYPSPRTIASAQFLRNVTGRRRQPRKALALPAAAVAWRIAAAVGQIPTATMTSDGTGFGRARLNSLAFGRACLGASGVMRSRGPCRAQVFSEALLSLAFGLGCAGNPGRAGALVHGGAAIHKKKAAARKRH